MKEFVKTTKGHKVMILSVNPDRKKEVMDAMNKMFDLEQDTDWEYLVIHDWDVPHPWANDCKEGETE